MSCGCKISVSEGEPGTRFAGYAVKYPRPHTPEGSTSVWVEFECNRSDHHPVNGSEHWYETDRLRITWSIPADAIWSA